MWTCREMKKEGWSNLSKSLWTAVLATLLLLIISGIFTSGQNAVNMAKYRIQFSGGWESFLSNANSSSPELVTLNLLQSFIGFLAVAASFFLINPLQVGYRRWFLTNRKPEGAAGINLLFSSFQQGSYMGIVGGTAWMTLWTIIWGVVASLCFIPLWGVFIAAIFSVVLTASGSASGTSSAMTRKEFIHSLVNIAPAYFIIFSILLVVCLAGYLAITLNRKYAYFFTSFILAENPTIGAKNALDLSKKMTYGLKGKLFVLDLSFIGWWLLSGLTCGILSLGVMPYTYAAYTEVYISRKAEQRI
ncbi:MAG: DUF975 family protein [Eubacteriales bacterium]